MYLYKNTIQSPITCNYRQKNRLTLERCESCGSCGRAVLLRLVPSVITCTTTKATRELIKAGVTEFGEACSMQHAACGVRVRACVVTRLPRLPRAPLSPGRPGGPAAPPSPRSPRAPAAPSHNTTHRHLTTHSPLQALLYNCTTRTATYRRPLLRYLPDMHYNNYTSGSVQLCPPGYVDKPYSFIHYD